jgi:nucleoside diphosphate kinase
VEQAREFLRRKSNDSKVATEIGNLSSGPMIVLCLSRENAIESWRELMGPENCSVAKQSAPTSLRALYGKDDIENAVYGTKNDDDVGHELRFFFPNSKKNTKLPLLFIFHV